MVIYKKQTLIHKLKIVKKHIKTMKYTKLVFTENLTYNLVQRNLNRKIPT